MAVESCFGRAEESDDLREEAEDSSRVVVRTDRHSEWSDKETWLGCGVGVCGRSVMSCCTNPWKTGDVNQEREVGGGWSLGENCSRREHHKTW
jgi:hypothetical protein